LIPLLLVWFLQTLFSVLGTKLKITMILKVLNKKIYLKELWTT